jgi:hypothetical protein
VWRIASCVLIANVALCYRALRTRTRVVVVVVVVRVANLVFDWSCDGYVSERDLFLARAVLRYSTRLRVSASWARALTSRRTLCRYLSCGKLGDANRFRDLFLARLPPVEKSQPATPLMNFVRFLLLTLEVPQQRADCCTGCRSRCCDGSLLVWRATAGRVSVVSAACVQVQDVHGPRRLI